MNYKQLIALATTVMDELQGICQACDEDREDADLQHKAFDEAQELVLTLQAIKEEQM